MTALRPAFVTVLVSIALIPLALAQIYLVSLGSDTIGAFTTGGATVIANLVTGLSDPSGIVFADGVLNVTSQTGTAAAGFTTDGTSVPPFFSIGSSYGIAAQSGRESNSSPGRRRNRQRALPYQDGYGDSACPVKREVARTKASIPTETAVKPPT